MTWEVVSAKRTAATRGVPSARVGRGSIVLNGASSNLIGPIADGSFAELMYDYEDGRVGIRFLEERTENAIPVRRRKEKGKRTESLAISSRAHMRELFGEDGVANSSTRYDVSIDPEERNVLVLVQGGQ